MDLTVLGCSAGCPVADNPASGYLIHHDETWVWCDAGSGTFLALLDEVDPDDLAAVVITHIHSDHCLDLFALYGYLEHGPGHGGPVPVFVPEQATEHLAAFARAGPGHRFRQVLAFSEVGDGATAAIGEITMRFATSVHPVPALSVRFEAGDRSLVYSGDTGPGGGVERLAPGADVLMCEATLQGPGAVRDYPFHLTAEEAGAIAAGAAVDRLILTHLGPTLDPRRSVAEAAGTYGHVPELAHPGAVFTI
jgi:ribonuclease BN (tRNA processing enzyme)